MGNKSNRQKQSASMDDDVEARSPRRAEADLQKQRYGDLPTASNRQQNFDINFGKFLQKTEPVPVTKKKRRARRERKYTEDDDGDDYDDEYDDDYDDEEAGGRRGRRNRGSIDDDDAARGGGRRSRRQTFEEFREEQEKKTGKQPATTVPEKSKDEDAAQDEKEKKDKEEKEKALLMMIMDDDDSLVFAGDVRLSREKWNSAWSAVKTLFLLAFAITGFVVARRDYSRRVCVVGILGSGNSYCLDYVPNKYYCTGIDNTDCKAKCGVQSNEGCKITFNATLEVQCYNGLEDKFKADCQDTKTCLSSAEGSLKNAMLLVSFLLAFLMIIECCQAAGFWHFSEYENSDFHEDMTKGVRCMFLCIKTGPFLSQLFWVISLFAIIYQIYTAFSAGSLCEFAQTATGGVYELPSLARYFTICITAFQVLACVFGSYTRHMWKLRGELFRPSFDESIKAPCGIDCYDLRNRSKPRICTKSTVKSIKKTFCFKGSPCTCLQWCPMCFAWMLDLLFTPVLLLGEAVGWSYKHRHFLGP